MRNRLFLLSLLGVCAFFTAQACGPEFEPDVFVHTLRPDKPEAFAAGKLGVVLPTYPRADLTVAYRYLNNGTLDPAEQAAYTPTFSMGDPAWEAQWNRENAAQQGSDPAVTWKRLRDRYTGSAPVVQAQKTVEARLIGGFIQQSDYINCNADAFATAAKTLEARAKAWGAQSTELADWLRGQDAVFSNCAGTTLVLPADGPAASPTLLRADRAYQQAAARFYGTSYDDARKGFEAIGQDANSPWHDIAPYLAARCLVRQAFHSAKPDDTGATFDPALMQQAADALRRLLAQNAPGAPLHAIQSELDLVTIRTEPLKRVHELSAALTGKSPDKDYAQHLTDLTWYLNQKLDGLQMRRDFSGVSGNNADGTIYHDLKDLRNASPLVDWLVTFQTGAPGAAEHAIAEWKSTHTQAWLAAAISQATGKDAAAADLVMAAAQVKPDSPAWELMTYHRIRLLIGLGRADEARALLAQTRPQIHAGGRDSSVNLFLGLDAQAARSLNEYLAYAPRTMIEGQSESDSSLGECSEVMKNTDRVYDCAKTVEPEQLSDDAAGFFNRQAPLGTMVEAAQSNALPQQLRTAVAMVAWVRAVLLKDDAIAQKLLPMLPEKLRQQAAPGTGMHPIMTILRNPGLRPYLEPGTQRSYSYDFVESYADNWWCQDWDKSSIADTLQIQSPGDATFLSALQRSQAETQLKKLADKEGAAIYFGGLVMDHAAAHPDDEDVPESLYLLLRVIRYGCDRGSSPDYPSPNPETKRIDELRSAAARLLRQHYATNPWTKKAAPYAG